MASKGTKAAKYNIERISAGLSSGLILDPHEA